MIRRELKPTLRLAGPVILAELGWMGMGVVDTIMVGPLGPAAIGAAGVGNSMHLGFAIFGMGLLLGLDTLVSQAYGARDLALCRAWLACGVRLALLTAVPLMLILAAVWFAVPELGFHEATLPLLQDYFAIGILSTPFLLLYAAFRRFLQSTHHVAPVMFALVSANLINGIANWVLIHGHFGMPQLGVAGSAWATVAARIYMCGVLWAAVRWSSNRRDVPRIGDLEPANDPASTSTNGRLARVTGPALETRPTIRRLVELGLPAASTVTAEVGVFAVATALAGRLEPVATASHQIALNIAAVAFMIPLGLASAGAVRVGNAVGARNPHGAAAAGWTVIAMGVVFMLCSGATVRRQCRRRSSASSPPTRACSPSARRCSRIAAVFQLFDGLQGVVTGTLRGLGDTRTPMITNLAAHWLIGLPVGYWLCFRAGLGARGLWWGLSLGLIVAGIVLTVVWARSVGRLQAPRIAP